MYNVRNNLFETNSSSMHSFVVTNKKDEPLTPEMIKEIVDDFEQSDVKARDWKKWEKMVDVLGFDPYARGDEVPLLEYNKWNYENELMFERAPMRILTTTSEKLAFLVASYNSWCKGRNNTETKKYLDEDIIPIMQKYIPNLRIEFPHISCEYDGKFWKDEKGFIYDEYDVYDKNGNWAATDEDKLVAPFHVTHVISYQSNGEVENKEIIPVALITDEEYNDIRFYGDVDHESCDLLKESFEQLGITIEDYLFNNKYIVITDGDEYNDFAKLQACGLIPDDAIKLRIYQSN